jgi:hypothetical protein
LRKVNIRLGIIRLVPIPFIAVWVASLLRGSRSVAEPAWGPWANIGLIVFALCMLFAALLVPRPLRRSREALERRRTDVEELLLLMGVGGADRVVDGTGSSDVARCRRG